MSAFETDQYNNLVQFWNEAIRKGRSFKYYGKNKHLAELRDNKVKVKSWEKGFWEQLTLF